MDADSHKAREGGADARGFRRVASLALVCASLAAFALAVVPGLIATASPSTVVRGVGPRAQGAGGFSHSTP
ncbi:MAG TPA: hypothetical protein VKB12_17580, partial [Pyrinomonadaceae bacterium]|nr:hypothetical protein [Pyrinomonadaceae bacterium]